MVLVDAIFINNGGGKVLLDFLISSIEKNKLEVFYILDERIKNNHPSIKSNNLMYLNGGIIERHKFYLRNRFRFSKVFCFGNLPPTIKLNVEVYTYFHQPMYLNIPKEFSFIERVKFNLKIAILRISAQNTNYWLVQSIFIKEKLCNKFNFNQERIKVLPFYPQFKEINHLFFRKKHTYLYVSNATSHKNHKRLIKVFCEFYDKFQIGELILTVDKSYLEIDDFVELKREKGYPIRNVGFVERDVLQKEYLSSEYLIFPSLAESFGLGLIEAIECGCKVIGADLPYTYEVCEPSLVFNPLDDESFKQVFENSLNENVKMSIPKIKNNINELITVLLDIQCN